jgi:hypothetical protein
MEKSDGPISIQLPFETALSGLMKANPTAEIPRAAKFAK